MSKLAALRAKLAEQENKSGGNKSRGDGLTFPFWDAPKDSTSTIRFLPDGNEDNPYFWAERQLIKLPFRGVKGHDENREVIIQVPCMNMFGESCPVMKDVSPWFDLGKEEKDMAHKYWKKKSYIFQGFVRDTEVTEDTPPENPIRKFVIGPQIYKVIDASLRDPEMEEYPPEYEEGLDFRLVKGHNGTFADYSTSKWARKTTALTQEERDAVETHGLVDLSTYLPAKPDGEHLNAIYEMFEASVEGELYDPARWGQYYKPWGLELTSADRKASGTAKSEPAASTSNSASTASSEAPAREPAASVPSGSAADILAKIQNR